MQRFLLLLAGPVFLTWGSYSLTVGRSAPASADSSSSVATSTYDVGKLRNNVDEGLVPTAANRAQAEHQRQLAKLCDERAQVLVETLNGEATAICRPPFVLGGDLTVSELEQAHRETILPTTRALSLMYFDHEPHEPICVLLFASESSYRQAAKRLDQRSVADYHGYYIRADRRLMINATTGAGTLAHELTHALAHFDFPNMPEWFDEGLASLYEESDFTADNLQLVGLSNWRLNFLINSLHHRNLESLESMLAARRIRTDRQAIDYAQSRYLCLYLQQRQLLPLYYRKLKANAQRDPTGSQTLKEIFGVTALDDIDREYRNWVIDVYDEQKRRTAKR